LVMGEGDKRRQGQGQKVEKRQVPGCKNKQGGGELGGKTVVCPSAQASGKSVSIKTKLESMATGMNASGVSGCRGEATGTKGKRPSERSANRGEGPRGLRAERIERRPGSRKGKSRRELNSAVKTDQKRGLRSSVGRARAIEIL